MHLRSMIAVTFAMTAFAVIAPKATAGTTDTDFTVIQTVLQHPRCQNCHIPGDAPLQFDEGRTHAQYVQRGAEGKVAAGLACSTCHGTKNLPASYGAHVPPGAPNWHLPPPDKKMVFIGLAAHDLCTRLKDPVQNNGKDLAALLAHVD